MLFRFYCRILRATAFLCEPEKATTGMRPIVTHTTEFSVFPKSTKGSIISP